MLPSKRIRQSVLNHEDDPTLTETSAARWKTARRRTQAERQKATGLAPCAAQVRQGDAGACDAPRTPARLESAQPAVLRRHGSVLEDHYHARLLVTPTQLVNAIAYVLGNAAHHYGGGAANDPFSSITCDRGRLLAKPESWLLRSGWCRAKRRIAGWPIAA